MLENNNQVVQTMKKKWNVFVLVPAILLVTVLVIFSVFWRQTDIPKLYLDGDLTGMVDKKDERKISFSYDDGSEKISGYAQIKIQGTSSLQYEKKNYTLKFYEDAECTNKLKLDVGWGPQSKYCMKANWIDRTHARNVVSARLVSQMQEKYGLMTDAPRNGAVDGFPVEIYSNGHFLGLYTFNIPKDDWQFAMDSDNPDHLVIGGEGWDAANYFLDMPDFDTWAVEVGEENDATLEKMNRLFAFILNSTDEEFRDHFTEYLDLDAALNYYVFSDIAYLKDNLGKNMLIATYDGSKWFLSLYDLDSSWGTETNGKALFHYEEELLDLSRSNLFARLETCFPTELAQRYFELREDVLSNENILDTFRSFREEIPPLTFVKEYIRWGNGVIRKPEDLPGYDYDQIEAYLTSVTQRLDEKYAEMLK